jgi:hypothetical protein
MRDEIIEELWIVKDEISDQLKSDFSNLDELLIDVKSIKDSMDQGFAFTQQEVKLNARQH